MYRFNGATIEKLYDIADIGYTRDARTGGDRYWILHAHDGSDYSRYEKSMGFDVTAGQFTGRISCFNGRGLYLYSRLSAAPFDKGSEESDFQGQGMPYKICWWRDNEPGTQTHNSDLYISRLYQKNGDNLKLSTNDDGTELNGFSGSSSAQIVTSIFDADLPFITKYLESVELVFDGTDATAAPGTKFIVEYRTTGFYTSSGWTTFGSILAGEFKRQSGWLDGVNVPFQQCQIRIYPDTTLPDKLGVKKIVLRYALNPQLKFEWNISLLPFGDGVHEPLMLADGTESTDSVRTLRGNVYASRESSTPVELVDLDPSTLVGSLNNSTNYTTLSVADGSLYPQRGIVQIDDEKFIYYSKSGNTLNLKPGANITPASTRGRLGTAAAAHSEGAKVYLIHRVFVRRIVNERIVLQDRQESVHPSTITVQLQEA